MGSLYIYSHIIQVNMIVIKIFFICQYHKIPWLTLIPKAVRTFKRWSETLKLKLLKKKMFKKCQEDALWCKTFKIMMLIVCTCIQVTFMGWPAQIRCRFNFCKSWKPISVKLWVFFLSLNLLNFGKHVRIHALIIMFSYNLNGIWHWNTNNENAVSSMLIKCRDYLVQTMEKHGNT